MIKRLCLAASAIALTACSVGPDYHRPETPTPAAWQAGTATGGTWPARDWWRGFNTPSLDQFMGEAQAANFDIAAAVARVRQADAQVKIAGAALLPTVQAGGGVSRTRSVATTPKAGGTPVGVDTYSAVLIASYEVDFWGRYADQVQSAKATADATRFDQQTTALSVQATVANTFFTIAALQDRIRVARNNLAAAESILEAFRARSVAGTAGGLDIAQQESVVAEQRASLPPLEQQLRQNVYALAILVGKLPEAVKIPETTLDTVALPAVAAGLPSGLLQRRPDVQFAEAELIAANANTKAAVASVFPNISLTAQGGVESTALSSLLSPSGVLYSLASSFTQPIFAGGALEGGIELNEARFDELVQDYRKAVISAFGDVETALVAVEMTDRQEEAQRAAVVTAQRAYDIAQAQLYSGTIDILTVLNTQRTLFLAQDLLVQARLAHAQAVVSLFRAVGGGWEVQV